MRTTLTHVWRFARRVLRRFLLHHGPLLASAVAFDALLFDALLSVVPLLGLALVIVVLLLSIEIAAIIVLLGGQSIAELDRSARAGSPWYQEPRIPRAGSAAN